MRYDSIYAIISKKDDLSVYNIEFYEKADGSSDVWDFMEALRIKADGNKDARIQLNQIRLYIQLLADNGTLLPENIRPITITYQGQSKTFDMPGWYPQNDEYEATFTYEDLEVYDNALKELKAIVVGK